jgi:hypothetical protein
VQFLASANGTYGVGLTSTDDRFIDARGRMLTTVYVSTLGGTSVDVRPVGTANPAAQSASVSGSSPGLKAVSYRTPGNAAYQSTATTINAGTNNTFHLDPSDMMPFLAIELSGMVGTVATTITFHLS